MEDRAILLKIKRDFTHNEAVQSLLKIVSALELETGVLKSELSEAKDKLREIRKERLMTKKQWLQEEAFAIVNKEKANLENKSRQYKKSMEEWRQKYFRLLMSGK